MLYAGVGKVSIRKFKANIKTISLLALLTTVISSEVYGLLFWGAALRFGIKLDIWLCMLFGCIVSPTDPIAATGILNKRDLRYRKRISFQRRNRSCAVYFRKKHRKPQRRCKFPACNAQRGARSAGCGICGVIPAV